MTAFDPELYLRLAGERMLLSRHGDDDLPWASSLAGAVQALVAVGAIDEAAAEVVLDDYMTAVALREDEEDLRLRAADRRPGPPQLLNPPRVVACDREVEIGGATVHVRYVSLAADATRLGVVYRPAARGISGGMGMIHFAGGPPPIVSGPGQSALSDDRGTKTGAHFSGGGSDFEWTGHFTADRPLAPDTAWIEIDGTRIELVDAERAIEVSVEPVAERDPALRHLWHVLAAGDRYEGRSPESAIAALVAAGALAADHPELAHVRAVASALGHGPGPSGRRSRGLPEPWRSLLAGRRRRAGPSGSIVVGAATPAFDGTCLIAFCLESSDSDWQVEVEVSPPEAVWTPFEQPATRPRQLAWWAADDRGNPYLGHLESGSGGDETVLGTVHFWPALDSEATRIDLMPTGDTERAVIRVPLSWGRTP